MPQIINQAQQELRLPFVLQPKEPEKVLIGNDEVGQLEIPRYGKLLDCELDTIESLKDEIADLRKAALRVAREISRASGKKLIDVYSAIASNDVDFLSEHIEQVFELRNWQENLEKKYPLIIATAIIAHRLVPGWRLADSHDPQKIPPKLLGLVVEFALQEKGEETEISKQAEEGVSQTEETQTYITGNTENFGE